MAGVAIEICKMSPLDTANQPLIKSKELGDCVYNALKHFCQANEYNEIGWLFLMTLDKVVTEKNELRGSNFQCSNAT